MSKYEELWKWLKEKDEDQLKLSFAQIEEICSQPLDHSFLKYKKELTAYGFQVKKISLKNETVEFERAGQNDRQPD